MNICKRMIIVTCLLLLVVAGCRPALEIGPTPSVATTGHGPESANGGEEVLISAARDDFDCTQVEGVAESECQTLVTFYQATGGPAWDEDGLPWEEGKTAWLQSNTPCQWVGVTCAGDHVDTVYLGNSGLRGQLPESWSGLTGLRVLDLHNNLLEGEIPAALGELSNLEGLDLSLNQLRGSIPASLGRLEKLSRLDLPHNQLSGTVPPELGNLPALHTLDLAYNQLGGDIPATLANLERLQTLRLNDNRLEGNIPAGFGALPELTEANLAFNQLSGRVPAGLGPGINYAFWGNRLAGTIAVADEDSVGAYGVQFTVHPALATSIWPEEIPSAAGSGAWWDAVPAHVRLTLAGHGGSRQHTAMGIQVPAEAQIHVYDLSTSLFDNSELEQSVRGQVAALQQLLTNDVAQVAEEPLPLLPQTNAAQMFHAQLAPLDFVNGRGIRYLTQYSQGPMPVANDQLFYTFQGVSADGSRYVAAFFPVSVPILPDTTQQALASPEAAAYLAGADDGYLTSIITALDEQPAAAFSPTLAQIDNLIRSLSVVTAGPAAQVVGRWPDEGEAVAGEPILQWEAYPGTAQYEIVVVDDDAYPPSVAFSHRGPETEVMVTPPLAPGSYSWTIRSLGEAGNTLAELNRTFDVYATLELVAPADLAEVSGTPTLTWKPFTGATRYEVSVVTGYPPEVVFATTTADTTVTVSPPLPAADVHYWTVWAKDEEGKIVAALAASFEVEP